MTASSTCNLLSTCTFYFALEAHAFGLPPVRLLGPQRTDLSGRLGTRLRERPWQHHLFRVARHRGVHAGTGSGGIRRRYVGGSPSRASPGLSVARLRGLRAGDRHPCARRVPRCPAIGRCLGPVFVVHPGIRRVVRALDFFSPRARRSRRRVAHANHAAHGWNPDASDSTCGGTRHSRGRMADCPALCGEYCRGRGWLLPDRFRVRPGLWSPTDADHRVRIQRHSRGRCVLGWTSRGPET